MDLTEIIEATDWDAYREAVQSAARAALGRYCHKPRAANDKVYQVEIWTDIRARLTAVNFETLHHAFQAMLGGQLPLSDEEIESYLPTCTGVVHNTNPANFLYSQYIMVANPELMDLARQDLLDDDIGAAVCSRVDRELVDAISELIDAGEFSRLPHEPGVWFAMYTVQSGEAAPNYLLI